MFLFYAHVRFFVAIFITPSMKIIPTRSILEEEKNYILIHIKA